MQSTATPFTTADNDLPIHASGSAADNSVTAGSHLDAKRTLNYERSSRAKVEKYIIYIRTILPIDHIRNFSSGSPK
jgi:hypothetical protein